jgi:uncharacterized Zn finger protein
VARRLKNGDKVSPVRIEGRKIATTFWGQAWCTNLESYSDFANRLPRGRTYARNGSIVHLTIEPGRIDALVSGSELYEIRIEIVAHSKQNWLALKEQCAGKIGTLVELLQGRLSGAVMELVTDREQGLFPKPKEIKMRCSCPDSAGMCKHLAAVMYGIGNRLDSSPHLLFVLRGLDHLELIEQALPTSPSRSKSKAATIASDDLGAIFDIEMDDAPSPPPETRKKPESRKVAKKATAAPTEASAAAKIAKTPASKRVAKQAIPVRTAPVARVASKLTKDRASTKITKKPPSASKKKTGVLDAK